MERGQSAVTCAESRTFPGSWKILTHPTTRTHSHTHNLTPTVSLLLGLPQFTLKVLLTKESKTSGLASTLFFVASVIFVSWRWWWAMITRCSAKVCQVCGISSFWRILCGGSGKFGLMPATFCFPLKNFVCMLSTFLIKSSGRRQIELAKVRLNIEKCWQKPPPSPVRTKETVNSFQKMKPLNYIQLVSLNGQAV